MRTKIAIIVAALVLGGLAAVLAGQYLRGARADIAALSEPVGVLVAQQDLPRGLTAEELVDRGLVKEERVPRQFVAADAVSSVRLIESQVLAVPVSNGEQLTKTRFQYPAQAGLSYSVPENLVALSVDVDDVKGVAGLLKPGDHVVVYATFRPDGTAKTAYSQVVVKKARVLAVGGAVTPEQVAEPSGGDGKTSTGGVFSASSNSEQTLPAYRTVTLGLSVEDAEHVVFAREIGSIQLALLPQNAPDPAQPPAVWFDGPDYGPFKPVVP